jgi:hypothetical protein
MSTNTLGNIACLHVISKLEAALINTLFKLKESNLTMCYMYKLNVTSIDTFVKEYNLTGVSLVYVSCGDTG